MYPAAKMKIANKKGRMVSAMGGSIVPLVVREINVKQKGLS
jgi:hypothetical protein